MFRIRTRKRQPLDIGLIWLVLMLAVLACSLVLAALFFIPLPFLHRLLSATMPTRVP